MATIVLQAQISPDDLLKAADQLSLTELEQFLANLLALRARRRAPGLPPEEAELLLQINRGIPSETRAQYEDLLTKREAETLTPEEHEELLKLVEQVEALQAERAEHLASLSRLRGVPLGALMDDLGIRRADDG
jgi:hypothetical protein